MTPNPNQIIKTVVVLCVLAVASFAAYQIGYKNGTSKQGAPQAQNGQPAVMEAHMLFGTVDKISGQELTLKDIRKIPYSDSAKPVLSVAVTVAPATVIERLVPKDQAVLKKEQDAFTKKLQAQGPSDSLVPPEPFIRTRIALSDIKVGDYLVVSSDQDLSNLTAFTATKIDLQDKPPATPPTTPVSYATTSAKINTTDGTPPPPIPAGAKVQ